MKKKAKPTGKDIQKTRAKPVTLPLSFNKAVEGLLAVQPKKKNMPTSKKSSSVAQKKK